MAKADWGTKHQCQNCGARFYDLKKTPIVCPECGTEYQEPVRQTRNAPRAEAKEAKPKVERRKRHPDEEAEAGAAEDEFDDDIEDEDDDAEEAVDLDEDDDDIAEVIDNPDTR